MVNSLFDCGVEKVERIVKNESGDNEIWEMNRDEINDNVSLLPTYIEEVCLVHL